ncbi:MAG: Na/Pi cotransporter family protein [Candidatus Gastranaerophilales bacterium]|nr:Na/Pi cotransporter family protein [Candidatus Gastranaerophilales bacterium]MCM1073224.1 Na/Pi cotransporter family protein [Bacteroides sp.]
MDIFSIFTLCGGLAFFLYGISIMSSGLEKIAGGRLEKILKKMTSNPIKSLVFGAGITAAVQSSSAVTVMLVGLVNSGIMKLSQTVSVIIGSNIGKTVTAWILSLSGIQSSVFFLRLLKPESFSPILALIGVTMIMVSKSNRRKNVGTVLMGFALLMFGMNVMSGAMAPLADMPGFRQALVAFTNPFLGMIVGLVVTMIIQSSAASLGILQALSMVGGITYGMAIPIIMGENIGTCISAVLSAIGVNTSAKRVAAVHVIYNVIGVAICLPAVLILNKIFALSFMPKDITPVGVAVVHTSFNLVAAAMLFPFIKLIEKIAIASVPEKQVKDKTVLLDDRLLLAPSFAIAECYARSLKMAEMVEFNFINSTKMLKSYHAKKAEQIQANEIKIDMFEDKLNAFMLKLSAKELTEEDNARISQLLLAIGDYERIGDHATYMLKIAEKLKESEKKLSPEAVEELKVIVHAVSEIFAVSFEAYKTDNIQLAQEVDPLEAVIKRIIRKVKNRHIQRLKDGLCTAELSFLFSDLLNDLRRIAAHCGNIATSVIQLHDQTIDKHEYNHRNKDEDIEFINKYENYKSRYSVSKHKSIEMV